MEKIEALEKTLHSRSSWPQPSHVCSIGPANLICWSALFQSALHAVGCFDRESIPACKEKIHVFVFLHKIKDTMVWERGWTSAQTGSLQCAVGKSVWDLSCVTQMLGSHHLQGYIPVYIPLFVLSLCHLFPIEIQESHAPHPPLLSMCPFEEHHVLDGKM